MLLHFHVAPWIIARFQIDVNDNKVITGTMQY